MVFGCYGHFWSLSNHCVLVLRSVGGCLGGFRVLRALLVSVQPLCTGFEVRGRVFRWFSGLTGTFGLGPTTVFPKRRFPVAPTPAPHRSDATSLLLLHCLPLLLRRYSVAPISLPLCPDARNRIPIVPVLLTALLLLHSFQKKNSV